MEVEDAVADISSDVPASPGAVHDDTDRTTNSHTTGHTSMAR
jgi:hypothetical protein